MIFFLRIIIFSFFIIQGFRFSVRSIKGRGFVSGIYGFVLLYYTFLCRVKITVDVSASDYTSTITTQRSVGESIWQLLKSIFGMDSSGHLAGVYWQAFILNSYLFIPLGFLVYLWLLCGDSTLSRASVAITGRRGESENRTLAKIALKTIIIYIATSLAIEVTQEITTLGMFDITDIIANSIGSCIGIGVVWLWQHFRRGKRREVA